jgi:hypothetical protein
MDQAALHHLPVTFVELLPPELVLRHLLCQQRRDHDDQDVRDSDCRSLCATPRRQPSVLRSQVGVFGACCCCLSSFDQGGAQPGASLPRPPRAAFAGALIVARTQPGPGREAARSGEAAQIRADLGEQDLSRPPANARNRLQLLQRWLNRAQALSNRSAHPLQTGIEEIDVGELLRDQEALMRAEMAGERLLQLGNLLAQSSTRQLRERRRIGRSPDQRLQDVAPRLAQDVRGDGRQLDVRPCSTFCKRLTSLARSWIRVVR